LGDVNYAADAFCRRLLIVPETATTCTVAGFPDIDVIVAMAVRVWSTIARFTRKIACFAAPLKFIGARLAWLAPYSP